MLELQIKDLCVAFNGKEILHNITFDIENGAFIGIVGPSGAGKSTLLKQINRLDPSKTGGSILWRGKDVDDYDVHELRRNLAYVFQKAVMFDGTTEENIKLSLKYGNEFKPEEIEALYQTVLEEASISQDILDTPAQDLSGGQQQRVGIARVLLMGSPVLLLDEPTASLDVETSNKFCQTLKQLKGGPAAKDGKKRTFLMITHRLEEAKFLADKILMIESGHVVEYTDCETFFYASSDAARRRLFESSEFVEYPQRKGNLSRSAGFLFLTTVNFVVKRKTYTTPNVVSRAKI